MFVEGADFTGIRRAYTLGPGQSSAMVQFGIVNDNLRETLESFTSTISTTAQRVDVVRPITQVDITDDEGNEQVRLSYHKRFLCMQRM